MKLSQVIEWGINKHRVSYVKLAGKIKQLIEFPCVYRSADGIEIKYTLNCDYCPESLLRASFRINKIKLSPPSVYNDVIDHIRIDFPDNNQFLLFKQKVDDARQELIDMGNGDEFNHRFVKAIFEEYYATDSY